MCSVLLIDDDEMIAESFRVLLEDRGFSVDVARCIRDGFARLEAAPVDVVFFDPFMSGAVPLPPSESLRKLRSLHPAAELVILTWYGTSALEHAVRGIAPAQLLQKPQSLTTLASIAARCVSERQVAG
jgi:DNA-binding NtrC family response regulator